MLSVLFMLLLNNGEVSAQADSKSSSGQPRVLRTIQLVVGKSVVCDNQAVFTRASLANPDIADLVVLSPKEVSVMGKSAGITNLMLWGKDGRLVTTYDLEVVPDVTRLKTQLHQLFPEEKHLQVSATHDHIALTGTIGSASRLTQVLALAEAYAPKKVLNLTQVSGSQQVMLEVRIAEMSRALLRRLGVNLTYTDGTGRSFGVSVLKNLTTVLPPGDQAGAISPGAFGAAAPPFSVGLSQVINSLFRFQTGSSSWTGFIDALKETNLVKILAEPTLVALSGQDANFLAGGEFPIPVPQAFGVTTVQFKKFGVQLNFTPTVLAQHHLSVTVTPEVSELDFANGLTLQGFTVPAITTRRASTVVELGDGQSFAIAGLLRDTVRETVSKFPLLGDIPILGALFRSTQFQKNETELVIVVTPHLVMPVQEAAQFLPTNGFIEPDDFDFYLMGRMDSPNALARGRPQFRLSGPIPEDRVDGPVGHVMPH